MTEQHTITEEADRLKGALEAASSSVRLRAALTAGTRPDPSFIEVLIARCANEPDFYVRDMLTWALIQHDRSVVVEGLLPQLRAETPQARSQALHTLSKIADPGTWPAITSSLLQDENDDVARTAWRAAAVLVPEEQTMTLAEVLSTQFGRGDRDVQLSLSRAFASLGSTAGAVVESATSHRAEGVRAHAIATLRIMADPEEGFDAALDEARRTIALLSAPHVEEVTDADR